MSQPQDTGSIKKLQTDLLKLRPRLPSSIAYINGQPHLRKRKMPLNANEKMDRHTNDETSKLSRMFSTELILPIQGPTEADPPRLTQKLRLRSSLLRTKSDRHRRYLRRPNVSDLSKELTNRLHLHENYGRKLSNASLKSLNNTEERHLRSRTSQEVIPTTACETEATMEAIFQPCQIRHVLGSRIWTRRGRTVALKVAFSQELFTCPLMTHSPGPSPIAFAYRIGESWFWVYANERQTISIRRGEIDVSDVDASDPRAFFMEYAKKASGGSEVILKSGAYKGCGITVNRRNRLALSDDPREWYGWVISQR